MARPRRHQRSITSSGLSVVVDCACGWSEDVDRRSQAVAAYRRHVDEATTPPSPFEPEVSDISEAAYRYRGCDRCGPGRT